MAVFSRRQFLAGAAALLSAPARLRAAEGLRVATLDWALLETLLAIGANVVAATELRQFREVAVTPDVPATTADLGLRGTPNFEVLRFVRPDLIFNSNFYAWADQRMRGVAPVESHAIYKPGESPFSLAEQATLAIGERLQLATARQLTEELAARLDRHRALLAAGDGRPVIPINLGDARHFRVFGSDSMFGEVLKRVGLTNAWQAQTSYSAAAPVGIEILASLPDAWIVMIPPHPADALATLATSSFWNALPAVREKRVLMLGSINPYGALPAAGRFADFLAEGLQHAWNG
ncbi:MULTISPECIES: ABC transporter substrate-binding protein [Rhizobium]|jgi:iron complex transport system substrate-binding protein|uniref:ABC transporter substrate-binding protein n=1 Tax=Rhizobium TaxID=379 RepID=UPI00027D80D8|nr:ABC transporter substrate-binding protein [Rhizobium leguminosarum]MBY2933196.1 ABC transporter substrate-binding protein [Rhizobium leguminosarum]MBY2946776.1 ABC transporter substrate-binding protein [Rhizobium leguminosarum]MBY2988066.1 ABC transporter substrate-binding protein [Rhizobium leguminosarum]MBY3029734.1 ABC transporter substrate-binding protein [Rhizobium leguminosarum]RWX29564.1 iron-siderophore ABC transporter substrate-binding protein [Rhizobium leguminosarum]